MADKCSEYLTLAAGKLDCAIQLCGDLEAAKEISEIEGRLDELAKQQRERGN